MIQLLFTLIVVEMGLIVMFVFKTPLRKLVIMSLDRLKRGRGPVIVKTVAGTVIVVMISIAYSMMKIKKHWTEDGVINPTDQVLMANRLLETSLMGFSLFLALMIDRLHHYIRELRIQRKSMEAVKEQNLRDFLLKFSEHCTDLPEGFHTSDIAEALMISNVTLSSESYPSPKRINDRSTGASRPDRRGSGMGDDEKWSKLPGPLTSGRDLRLDIGYGGNAVGFRPAQGGNYGVLRNPGVQTPVQYSGGILSGPMHSLGSQGGMQRNSPDSDRWQRATAFQKGLIPSAQTPLQAMHRARRQLKAILNKQRQLKAILNKLTPQNFKKLFEQVKAVNIDNAVTLTVVVSQIFDKALMEPTFCEMYANLCSYLAGELPDFSEGNEKITFKRLLLNKCQEEFERGERELEEANRAEVKQSEEEREQKRIWDRRRMLGNIRLIGELYKKMMLPERIMHYCIKKLLGQDQNPDEGDVEALCKLMSTIGEIIDHPKAKEHMDAYFDMMERLSNNMKLSSRVRFMLKDAIDLRKNKWQQRRKVEEFYRYDLRLDIGYGGNAVGFRPAQGGNYGVLRNPGVQTPVQYSGGILSGPMHSLGSQGGMQRNSPDSDRWQCATAFQKGLIPSSQTPLQAMHRARRKYQVGKVTDEEEAKHRQLKAILNKLTPQNFEKLFEQVKAVNIDNVVTLAGVVSQIFDKALMEPTFCEMYANLYSYLAGELPDFSEDNEKITFKRLLLNKCQEEFERGEREQEEANRAEVKQSEEEREEKRMWDRRRMLGSIRLIGELYKKKMLTERIMHYCIQKLLGQYQNPDEGDVEALCKLMSTIGEIIDHPKAKKLMDAHFDVMERLSNNMKLSSRVRFMLKDAIDLRKNKWQQRRKVEEFYSYGQ